MTLEKAYGWSEVHCKEMKETSQIKLGRGRHVYIVRQTLLPSPINWMPAIWILIYVFNYWSSVRGFDQKI